jgi:SAM-dependent methyltransferase
MRSLLVSGSKPMNTQGLKNDWEALAESDAFGAILTDPSRMDGKWQASEFMATGHAEMEIVMRHLQGIGLMPSFEGAALDFGCGVGRVTQSLATRFASCIGLDISQEMIKRADAFNRHEHCIYRVHADTVLPFANGTFSFIYSNIVLQHIPRRLSTRYLREFVRVLMPRGVLVFGVQDSFAAPDISSQLTRLRQILRIRSRVQALLGTGHQMQMHCVPERVVRRALSPAIVADVQLTNTAAKDFNGKLVYLPQAPRSGYVGKQYCVVKEH